MAGINELPNDLKAKLQPYFTVGGATTVEEAIDKAKQAGSWTAEDDAKFSALNGGANWGNVVDAFNPSNAAEYRAQAAAPKKEQQGKVLDLSEKYGKYANIEERKEELRRNIVEKRSQGVTGYAEAMKDWAELHSMPSAANKQEAFAFWPVLLVLAAVGVMFTSCEKDEDVDAAAEAAAKKAAEAAAKKAAEEQAAKEAEETKGTEETSSPLKTSAEKNPNIKMISLPVTQIVTLNLTFDLATLNEKIAALTAEVADLKGKVTEQQQNAIDLLMNIYNEIKDIKQNEEVSRQNFEKMFNDVKNLLAKIGEGVINIEGTQYDVVAQLKELVDNTDLTNIELIDIQKLVDAIGKGLIDVKKILENIDQNVEQINEKMSKQLGLSTDIDAKLDAMMKKDSNVETILNNIYDMMGKLGNQYDSYFKVIIEKLANGEITLDDLKKEVKIVNQNLTNLNGLVTKYGEDGNALGQAILQILADIDFSKADVDLSKIENYLKKLINGQDIQREQIGSLANLIKDRLDTIIAKLDKNATDYTTKLNTIIQLLTQLDANNDARNQKVLDAIEKLGFDVTASLTAILNKISGGGEGQDYSSVLNAILAKLGDMQNDNKANFKKVIDALANISTGGNVDLDPIMKKLDEILKAIKDHKVTVDVTGNVCCNCSCGDSGVHEGILGDLNDLLG